ncbi:MAG: MBL fold metallo-hydrolase [Pseudonocardia sp.]
MMKVGFLGHNGFALGDPDAPVLVDPILFARYGEEYTSSPVEIYPPRVILADRIPAPAAVVVSHEHSDHFHLPSLDLLPRTTPIVVGPQMIQAVVDCVEHLGFTVHRLPFGKEAVFGDVALTLHPAGAGTVLWESRVSQVHARPARPSGLGGLFLGIDALVSESFVESVETGAVPAPVAIAVSNNAQITPPGVFGSLDVLTRADLDTAASGLPDRPVQHGLRILHEILDGTIRQCSAFRGADLLICGGGFLKDYEEMGPFPFSEQRDLARAAQALVSDIQVIGPEPGDRYDVVDGRLRPDGRVGWIDTDRERFAALRARRAGFLASARSIPMKRIVRDVTAASEAGAVDAVQRGLGYLAKVILLAELGGRMLAGHGSRGDTTPMLVRLLGEHATGNAAFALDLRAGGFVRVPVPSLDEALSGYPFGIVVHAVDLAAVLSGELQIWDVVGVGMRSWYEGESFGSPVALMFDAFGEQVRPDIACRVYAGQLAGLEPRPERV